MVFSPDGRFLREIGEGMTPRLFVDAESDMSLRQSSRTRFRSPRRRITPGRSKARLRDPARNQATSPSAGLSGSAMKGNVAVLHPDFGGDAKRVLKAMGRSLAIIEFEPNGTVIAANENFCRLLGCEPAEIKGKPHSQFVDPDYREKSGLQGVLGQARTRRIRRRRIQAHRQGRKGSLDSGLLQSRRRRVRESAQGRQGRHRHHRRQTAGGRERRQARRRSRARRPSSNSPPTGRSSPRTRIS